MRLILKLFILAGLTACQGTPVLQSGPNAEITYDGLVRVDNTRVDKAWLRPEIDMASYDSIMLVGAGVKFRSVRETNRIYLSNFEGMPLNEEQRNYVQEVSRDIFTEGISDNSRFTVVTDPGPNTLALTGSLIDVVSYVPPQDDSVDRIYHYLTQLGEATLVLELSDSLSGQTLARATDTRIIEPTVVELDANITTNRFEFERELRLWVDYIRDGLELLGTTPIVSAE